LSDDGVQDDYELAWDEETADAENDVMGLALSFTLIQALRWYISGVLANVEGEEEGPGEFAHTKHEIGLLLGAGMFFLALTWVCLVHHGKIKPEDELKSRMSMVFITTYSMAFSWCTFYGFRWLFAATLPVDLIEGDATLLSVLLAMFLSMTSVIAIFAIDYVADASWTGESTDMVLREIIRVLGMLIGFAWEQAFDASEAALAQVTPQKHLAKLGLALFSTGILIPAWRYHMLPMVVQHGWKFGFVVERTKQAFGGWDNLNAEHAAHVEEERKKKEAKKPKKENVRRASHRSSVRVENVEETDAAAYVKLVDAPKRNGQNSARLGSPGSPESPPSPRRQPPSPPPRSVLPSEVPPDPKPAMTAPCLGSSARPATAGLDGLLKEWSLHLSK